MTTHWRKSLNTEVEVNRPGEHAFRAARAALAECGFDIGEDDDLDTEEDDGSWYVSGVRRMPSPVGPLPYSCSVYIEGRGGRATLSSTVQMESEFTARMALILVAVFAPIFLILVLPPAFHAVFGIAFLAVVIGFFVWTHFSGANRYAALDAEVWAAITRRTGPARSLKRQNNWTGI